MALEITNESVEKAYYRHKNGQAPLEKIIYDKDRVWPKVPPSRLVFSSTEDSTLYVKRDGEWDVEYSYDEETWLPLEQEQTLPLYADKDLYVRGKNCKDDKCNIRFYQNGQHDLDTTNKITLSGHAEAVFNYEDIDAHCGTMSHMFDGCYGLYDARDLVMPSTMWVERQCEYMFHTCVHLVYPPSLPAMTMTMRCYQYMFNRCNLLSYISLPATRVAPFCYAYMLQRASISRLVLPAKNAEVNCYDHICVECKNLREVDIQLTRMASDCLYFALSECDSMYSVTVHFVITTEMEWKNYLYGFVSQANRNGIFYHPANCYVYPMSSNNLYMGIPTTWMKFNI